MSMYSLGSLSSLSLGEGRICGARKSTVGSLCFPGPDSKAGGSGTGGGVSGVVVSLGDVVGPAMLWPCTGRARAARARGMPPSPGPREHDRGSQKRSASGGCRSTGLVRQALGRKAGEITRRGDVRGVGFCLMIGPERKI
jgi:hypothetical protein